MAKKIKNNNNITHYYSLLNRLRDTLGEDLIYSMAMDTDHDGEPLYIIGVATARSKTQRFNHDRLQQTAVLSNADLEDDVDNVVNSLIQLYKAILISRVDDDKPVEGVDYKIDITLKDKDGNILQ